MNKEQIDCRGLACPAPVLKAKEILDKGSVQQLTVLVDNTAAKENVSRLLARCGYQVEALEQEQGFAVTGRRMSSEPTCEILAEAAGDSQPRKILVLVATDRIGHGDDVLGGKLMANFLATLAEMGGELWRLVLVNAGVKLAIEGSDILSTIQALDREPTQILVCGTCLNHFGILEQKRVGETTNMLDIVTAMQLADKVITVT
ncbi:MAG TPA: sulfurtransferase-like selenium metabolism protein YedF [Syntrophobacteraceae bacterium]|nr:sulfurtransferase-like selenium metabolism protein YedF [Syntrophobacteraceae bacterium]